MGRFAVIAAVLVALALAGWHFRGYWQTVPAPALVSPAVLPVALPVQAPKTGQRPDVLYTWVDKDGVTHFEQDAGLGARVVYDGRRITPLPPVQSSPGSGAAGAVTAAKAQAGEGLHRLRRELEAGAQRMREAKASTHDR